MNDTNPSILDLPARVAALPDELGDAFERIFAVATATGRMELPEQMLDWTARQFGSVDAVQEQTVVKVTNQLTLEAAVFNPIRARRPAMGRVSDDAVAHWIEAELRDDIFAHPEHTTPADVFGRIRGAHCVSASNIAKYDGWHGVIVAHEPHPLRFSREQVADYVDVAWRWIAAAHAHDPQAIYPVITWNCMPKSGASLAHGHLQVALGRDIPFARIEMWRRAAASYQALSGRTYLADLQQLHEALGLGLVEVDGVRRFVHLTPARNREIVLLDKTGKVGALADALYETLHNLVTLQGVRAFNAVLAFPPLADDGLDWRGIMPFARIGDRGDPLSVRSDIGAMELYGTSVITVDPFEVMHSW